MLDVLVADDDSDVRRTVVEALRGAGHRVTEACDGIEAVSRLTGQSFDLAICDVRMPRLDGHALLRRIRRESPETSVVMMTTFASVADVVGSLRDGAVNYVSKPFDVDDFIAAVVTPLAERRSIARRFEEARAEFVARKAGATLITKSTAMGRLSGRISMVATSAAPVLITGEKGVGKELVARAIHAQGSRRDGPLVVVEASGVQELMEASAQQQLAVDRGPRDAWFRAACDGTLVVDGLERLPLRSQAELLRILDEPTTRPRRGPSWEPRGVRLICTSRVSLSDKVASGELMDSLYYRINAIHLHVPTLRERGGDLCPLVVELLRDLAPPGTTSPALSSDAWATLSRHEFAGNVRELRWALERALFLANGEEIDVHHLPPEVSGNGPSRG